MSEIAESELFDEELKMAFLEESLEALKTISPTLVHLETSSEDKELVNSIFRPIHSIKGNAAFFGLHKLRSFSHELESLLAMIRDRKCSMSQALADTVLSGIDEVQSIIERLYAKDSEVQDLEKHEFLLAQILAWRNGDLTEKEEEKKKLRLVAELRASLVLHFPEAVPQLDQIFNKAKATIDAVVEKEDASSTPVQQSPEVHHSKNSHTHKMMRVREDDIDGFLSSVGELLEIGEALYSIADVLVDTSSPEKILKEIKRVSQDYAKVSDKLRGNVMSIRRISAKSLFGKIPKIVRDVARARSKNVTVELIGDELLLDKSLLEILDAPLVHIIRNAVDHGIENPDIRSNRGKDPIGVVKVSLVELEKNFVLTVEDDGGGINLEALSSKALALGLIQEGAQLSQENLVSLIFAAGVSTAETVTDISGRGVGMDVVRRQVEEVGGEIDISTVTGKGSCFQIKLPKSVSTQIVTGLLTVVGSQEYIIPTEYIRETFSYSEEQLSSLFNKENCVFRHGEYLPVIDLVRIFHDSHVAKKDKVILSICVKSKSYAIVVDEVKNVRNTVVKKLSALPMFEPIFSGAAISSGGKLALVLDIEELISQVLLGSSLGNNNFSYQAIVH